MEGVQAATTIRNLEPVQWRNREEWSLVSERRRQLLKNRIYIYIYVYTHIYPVISQEYIYNLVIVVVHFSDAIKTIKMHGMCIFIDHNDA